MPHGRCWAIGQFTNPSRAVASELVNVAIEECGAMRTAHGCLAVRAVGSASRAGYPPGMKSSTLAGASPQLSQFPSIATGVSIGHVHLKVANLDRAIAFYRDVLGFEVTERFGRSAAFLSAGGYHHHIGLNTRESEGGRPPSFGTTGLYHAAILYPTRSNLADALRRLLAHGIRIEGASDHGVSEAIYLRDPDGNGLELYWDRPRDAWPRNADGSLAMFTEALDIESLLA